MPALRLLHRRWGIAGDDVILAIPPLLFHLAWVITLPVRTACPGVLPALHCSVTAARNSELTEEPCVCLCWRLE